MPLLMARASAEVEVILKDDMPLHCQMNTDNTTYIIRLDFDLNGDTLNIPFHSILKFEGGGLNNGTIVGDNSIINAKKTRIFTDVRVCGFWANANVYSDWFDFSKANNDFEMQSLFGLAKGESLTHLYLKDQSYYISSCNIASNEFGNILIPSNTHVHNDGIIKILTTGARQNYPIYLKNVENVTIEGGKIDGQIENYQGIPNGQTQFYGIHCRASKNITIKNVRISGVWGGGVSMQLLPNTGIHNENIIIDNVVVENNGGSGFTIEDGINVQVKNCLSQNNGNRGFWTVCSSYHIEPSYEMAAVENLLILHSKSINSLRTFTVSLGKIKEYSEIKIDEVEGDGPIVMNNLNGNSTISINKCKYSDLNSFYHFRNVILTNCKMGKIYVKSGCDNVSFRRCQISVQEEQGDGALCVLGKSSIRFENCSIESTVKTINANECEFTFKKCDINCTSSACVLAGTMDKCRVQYKKEIRLYNYSGTGTTTLTNCELIVENSGETYGQNHGMITLYSPQGKYSIVNTTIKCYKRIESPIRSYASNCSLRQNNLQIKTINNPW